MDENPSSLPWTRFVALGDSLTEGIGDPVGGRLRGWADRLAAALKALDPALEYHNLARRSLTTDEIRREQLQRALALEPDLVGVVAGMNDVLAKDFDPVVFRSRFISLIEPLKATGATVLVGTLPRDLPLLRLMPRRRAEITRKRLEAVSDVVLAIARKESLACMDAPEGWRYTMAECSIDGCHPNAKGHAHIAALALEALTSSTRVELPPFEYIDCSTLKSSAGHLRWLASHGLTRLPAFLRGLRANA